MLMILNLDFYDRQVEGGRRGRRDFQGVGGGYDGDRNQRSNDQRSFQGGDGNFEENWSRTDSSAMRNKSSFPMAESRRNDSEDRVSNEPWSRTTSQGQQYPSRFENDNSRSESFRSNRNMPPSANAPMQRPDHLRLKIEPRSTPVMQPSSTTAPISNSNNALPDIEDKWSKVFSNKSKQAPNQNFKQKESSNVFNEVEIEPRNNIKSLPKNDENNKVKAEKPIAIPIVTPTKPSAKESHEKQKLEKELASAKSKQDAEASALVEIEMSKLALELLNTKLKGEGIKEFAEKMETKPSCSSFVGEILKTQSANNFNILWLNDSEYGIVLKYLVKSNDQVNTLFAIQNFCHTLKFPKIDIKGTQRSLIEVIFQLLFKKEIVDDSSFLSWADDERDSLGRVSAIVQTTNFIQLLTGDSDEDFEEEDDVDRPREIVK